LLSSDSIAFPRFKRMIGFLQLGVSLFLIVSSVIMRRQITYSLVKEPGQNHDQIVYLNYPDHLSVSLNGLREALRMNSANVVDVIATSQLPDRINSKELNTDFYLLRVDPEFKNFFDLEMTHGNWFKANDGDSIFVVSEKAKHQLGSDTTNLIGTFRDLAGQFNLPERPLKISMFGNIKYNFLCIRVLEVDIRRTVAYLNRYFSTASRSEPLRFFNKRFEEWLSYQDRLNKLSETMAVISAILACCAIYGLCVGLVREKLKQIAIHKLFGAGTRSITTLLIKEFASQMGMAILFFGPLSYIVIQEILRNFVYRTHFVWLDPLLPLVYCGTVIVVLCGLQAATLNRGDLVASLKG